MLANIVGSSSAVSVIKLNVSGIKDGAHAM
jgi:hypothetical protein